MFAEVISIIVAVVCAIMVGVLLYYRIKGNVVGEIVKLITIAEETGLPGSEKMEKVVDALYEKVPAAIRKILTKDRLKELAQNTFDWMRKYADTYIERSKDDTTEAERNETAVEVGVDVLTELLSQLMGAGLKELQEIAIEKGIVTDGLKTKKDYAQAIIRAVLNKA